ncbi:hypothetical protein BKA70DRAFT_1236951 [Coprinopsis sp. MPI-PUGE-AT-0042]|nr:hypothetical protein BKA70DRAFT_1236951 [Coprinopsis sp. MPI-PUGE-AT-0042]
MASVVGLAVAGFIPAYMTFPLYSRRVILIQDYLSSSLVKGVIKHNPSVTVVTKVLPVHATSCTTATYHIGGPPQECIPVKVEDILQAQGIYLRNSLELLPAYWRQGINYPVTETVTPGCWARTLEAQMRGVWQV